MDKKITSILPASSLLIISLCAMGILSFFLLIIFPNHQKNHRLEVDIKETQQKIEHQRILSPLFKEFKTMLKAARETEAIDLPSTEAAKIKQEDIYGIQDLLRGIANENRLDLETLQPDVSSLVDGSDMMRMYLSVTGKIDDFHRFLMQMIEKIPAMERMESIRIERTESSADYRLFLDIWLAQELN